MALKWTRDLLIGATVLGGMLAGMALDRAVVQIPAWRLVGASSWVLFSRNAELGRGLVFYPAQGVGALLLSIAAAVTVHFGLKAPRAARIPFYAAAVLAIVAFFVTRFAMAADLLALKTVVEPASAQRIFDHVAGWWTVKAALHVLTFAANVWSLAIWSAIAVRR